MTEYAPPAIQQLFNDIKAGIPAALMGGILGDSAHTYGYHRGRNYVSGSDYSVQLSADKQGDGEAASALDISWNVASDQYTVSQRLLNAKKDSRITDVCRSFFGSVDGVNVCGWDFQGQYAVTSDDSHLWHVHLSILRKYATDYQALAPVADVIIGQGSSGGGGEEEAVYRVSLDRSTDITLSGDEQRNVGWDQEQNDTGDVFVGKNTAPDPGKFPERIVLDGAHYVSTFSFTAKDLAKDQSVFTAVVFADKDGTDTGQSPWQEHVGSGGDTFVVDTRGYWCNKGKSVKVRVKANAPVTLTKLSWRVIYWK